MHITLLTEHAKPPVRATQGAAGYDVFSAVNATIAPGQRALIPLDLQITPPDGTYIQLASRSGLAVKHQLDVKAGVIDADFTGNITVVIHNHGTATYNITTGDRIAQILVLNITHPHIIVNNPSTNTNTSTPRGNQGFGSTGIGPTIQQTHDDTLHTNAVDIDLPYDIYLSNDPFDHTIPIEIPIKGDHPTLGLTLIDCPHRQRPRLTDMVLSTPGSRIPKWRSILRNAYITEFDGQTISTTDDLKSVIAQARQ
jgi:dUTP pyrophosphatase